MSFTERIHGSYVQSRRVRVLAQKLAAVIPQNASVLDIGCGDGALAHTILQTRPDLKIRGIDVLVRNDTLIPVEPFDGQSIPHESASFDVAMFVDVLHHTDDPMVLLKEARRVAKQSIVIKDHTKNGILANATLRFMDRVGNARYGVALPHNYWPKEQWLRAIDELGLVIGTWETNLSLYPAPANWIFGRSLHFIARLDVEASVHNAGSPGAPGEPSKMDDDQLGGRGSRRAVGAQSLANAPTSPNPDPWEAAYLRFETPDQEIAKFIKRLTKLGAQNWPRDSKIVDLFCGRGNGMVALTRLGFTNLEGVDLSARLAHEYKGQGKIHVADCRHLPFDDQSRDIAIVQGGLHHLPTLPDDLEQTLGEVRRILRPGGRFVVVEPWLTPFLRALHVFTTNKLARKLSWKLDAYQTMVDHEIRTFEAWLGNSEKIVSLFDKYFEREMCEKSWGKIMYVGRVSPTALT